MNKPLTIEQLKSLEVGDWVWIVDELSNIKGYAQVEVSKAIGDKGFIIPTKRSYGFGYYDTYGTKWLAYKNKEMAESKGEIVELPCIRTIERKAGKLYEVVYVQIGGMIGSETYPNKTNAERRLAELRGEK